MKKIDRTWKVPGHCLVIQITIRMCEVRLGGERSREERVPSPRIMESTLANIRLALSQHLSQCWTIFTESRDKWTLRLGDTITDTHVEFGCWFLSFYVFKIKTFNSAKSQQETWTSFVLNIRLKVSPTVTADCHQPLDRPLTASAGVKSYG